MVKEKKVNALGLSAKEETVALLLVEGETKKKSMEIAGYSTKSNTSTICNTPKMRDAMLLILKSKKIDQERISTCLDKGLDATKIVGTSDDFIEVPDYIARHKYMETLIKLLGLYPDTSIDHTVETMEDKLRRIHEAGDT